MVFLLRSRISKAKLLSHRGWGRLWISPSLPCQIDAPFRGTREASTHPQAQSLHLLSWGPNCRTLARISLLFPRTFYLWSTQIDLIHGSFWITRSTVVLRQNQRKARIEEEPEEGALASELQLPPHTGERRDWTPNHTGGKRIRTCLQRFSPQLNLVKGFGDFSDCHRGQKRSILRSPPPQSPSLFAFNDNSFQNQLSTSHLYSKTF